jgi:glycosyltransferase involved in cell wall biosynthesis
MRVEILLPQAFPDHPIGGYAVAYRYANSLVRQGHAVRVQHLTALDIPLVRRRARQIKNRSVTEGAQLARWYPLDPRVHLEQRSLLRVAACRRADAVIATSWQTAEELALLRLGPRRAFYLVQHHETWAGPQGRVNATLSRPMTRLAISSWLIDACRELAPTAPVIYLPNAIDPTDMFRTVPSRNRDPLRVAMMWHPSPWKGSSSGIEALRLAQLRLPELRATIFSASERPAGAEFENLDWLHKPTRLELRSLLNEVSIFVSPSETEGWGLPQTEAMACGAALLSTDIPGVRDYATAGTSVLVPPKDPELMADALVGLVQDHSRRFRLSDSGHERVTTAFSWATSEKRLENALKGDRLKIERA